MNRLILHIGCGKTGSSALQSWLAINQEKFRRGDVNYAGDNLDAKALRVNSGNASPLLKTLESGTASPKVLRRYFGRQDTAIISSEDLQRLDLEGLGKLDALLSDLAVETTVVAYVRNLYDTIYSAYVQGVKRHNRLVGFEEMALMQKRIYPIDVVRKYMRFFNVELIHYDSVVDNVAKPFCEVAGLDYETLIPLAKQRVNRSLSHDEIAVVQLLGRWLAERSLNPEKFSTIITDELINEFPDVESQTFYSEKVYRYLVDRFGRELDEFNREVCRGFGFQLSILTDGKDFQPIAASKGINEEVLQRFVDIMCRQRAVLGSECLVGLAQEIESVSSDLAEKMRQAAKRENGAELVPL